MACRAEATSRRERLRAPWNGATVLRRTRRDGASAESTRCRQLEALVSVAAHWKADPPARHAGENLRKSPVRNRRSFPGTSHGGGPPTAGVRREGEVLPGQGQGGAGRGDGGAGAVRRGGGGQQLLGGSDGSRRARGAMGLGAGPGAGHDA